MSAAPGAGAPRGGDRRGDPGRDAGSGAAPGLLARVLSGRRGGRSGLCAGSRSRRGESGVALGGLGDAGVPLGSAPGVTLSAGRAGVGRALWAAWGAIRVGAQPGNDPGSSPGENRLPPCTVARCNLLLFFASFFLFLTT